MWPSFGEGAQVVFGNGLVLQACSYLGLLGSLPFVIQNPSVADIQGVAWRSPYEGYLAYNLTGVVTAKGPVGVWIADQATSDDERLSTGVYVFSQAVAAKTQVGDLISVNGKIVEFRAFTRPNDLTVTEIASATNLVVRSSNHSVKPLVLGVDRSPPTERLSALDVGSDGWLSVPNNQSAVTSVNATLSPAKYGLDFWESLEGQLVTITNPVALNFEDRFHSFWVHGDWHVTGKNARGGLTITFDADGVPDGNPETILVGRALDKTKSPNAVVGQTFSDITGVVHYQFGYYYILPLTAPSVKSKPDFDTPAASFSVSTDPCTVTIGDYNVENMSPRSRHIPTIATHIADLLHSPDVILVQEIQDDSGPRDNGVVTANRTLSTLVEAIKTASDGVEYSFIDIPPEDKKDGGQPGGNIRVAYLYRPDKVSLVPGTRGSPAESNEVIVDDDANVGLKYNPGRIDPNNEAWYATRKPLAAHWQTAAGVRFFTVNVHFSSKRGSASSAGDARPPVNGGISARIAQANVTATFIEALLAADPDASIIVGGDMNEYAQTRAVVGRFERAALRDANVAAGVPPVERYTYMFDQNTQEIDHLFVSEAIAARGVDLAHVHVNTWAPAYRARASDHDPSVAQVLVCDRTSND